LKNLKISFFVEVAVKTNEALLDRAVRILIGIVGVALIATKVVTGVVAIVVGIGAGVMLITGAIGFCAIYALVGVATCKVPKTN
jgi:hypothetical protein